jgi:hypothetical protein
MSFHEVTATLEGFYGEGRVQLTRLPPDWPGIWLLAGAEEIEHFGHSDGQGWLWDNKTFGIFLVFDRTDDNAIDSKLVGAALFTGRREPLLDRFRRWLDF